MPAPILTDPTFSDSVKRTLADLADIYPLRVRGSEARHMIGRLKRETDCSRGDYRALWSHPEDTFGRFDSLPKALRVALGDAIGWEMREQRFVVSDRLYRAVHGPVFRFASELAGLGKRIRARGPAWRSAGRTVFLCGRGVMASCEWLGRRWMEFTRHAPFTRTSGFHALWKWAGVDPVPLTVGYVDGIPYDPRMSPVYRLSGRNVESSALIGLDLLVSNRELVYLEANFNPGMRDNRLRLYPKGDPIGIGLCRYAREHGFVRVVFYPSSISSVSRGLEAAWRTPFDGQGIELEIRDDPHQRSPWRRSWEPLMDVEADGTLYVNSRTLPSPLNAVIRQKGLLEREIERHNREAPEGERVRTPRRIRSSRDIEPPQPDSRFPNLIVKHSLRDQASDHTLYKTDRLPDGIESPPYVVYEYVPPDRVARTENGTRAEYAFCYRSLLFITPHGPRYLGGLKSVGLVPVPDRLPTGRVPDNRPYVINSRLAATVEAVTPAEDESIESTTLRVGRVIDDFLHRKHELIVASPTAR